jgi:hypothetical protein
MTMPNFFIIGGQKAGTTSLYHYLNQHPHIYMSPVKEPFFFNNELDSKGEVVQQRFAGPARRRPLRCSNIEEYHALFRGVGDETAIGEASTLYLYAPGTAERIKRYVPEARIIALLRNPADRAYSSFLHAVRIGAEPLTDFAQALREEAESVRNNWRYVFHYRNMGFYSSQLERYYEVFGRERVEVWLYEDLRDDSSSVAQSVFRFLEVDDSFVPNTSSKHNPAGVPKSRFSRTMVRAMDRTASLFLENFTSNSRIYPPASRLRRRIQSRILAKPPPLDSEVRIELIEGYKNDILKLEALIGRDLSKWLDHRGKYGGSSQPDYPATEPRALRNS